MKIPQVEQIEPQDLLLLKVIAFRKAERKLSHKKRSEQLNNFDWEEGKMMKYMIDCDKVQICEYTKDKLDNYKEVLKRQGMSKENLEEFVKWKIYESREKLTREYEDYLGIRTNPGDKPVKLYRKWLRDVIGYNDKELDEMTYIECRDSSFGKSEEEKWNY